MHVYLCMWKWYGSSIHGILYCICLYWCSSLNEHNLNKDLSELNKQLDKLKRENQKMESIQDKLEDEVSP